MVIDIISYTDEQFAELSEEQILQVKSAQLKKNAMDKKLKEDKLKEKHRLIDSGMFLSKLWERYCEELQSVYDEQVQSLRDSLLFYLRFSARPDGEEAPYTVDYSLTMEERYYIVRDYYMEAYDTANRRAAALLEDKIARQYLGELYAPLYDYLLAAK